MTLKKVGPVLAALLVVVGLTASAYASPFNIQLNFLGGLTASQQAIFSAAEATWDAPEQVAVLPLAEGALLAVSRPPLP